MLYKANAKRQKNYLFYSFFNCFIMANPALTQGIDTTIDNSPLAENNNAKDSRHHIKGLSEVISRLAMVAALGSPFAAMADTASTPTNAPQAKSLEVAPDVTETPQVLRVSMKGLDMDVVSNGETAQFYLFPKNENGIDYEGRKVVIVFIRNDGVNQRYDPIKKQWETYDFSDVPSASKLEPDSMITVSLKAIKGIPGRTYVGHGARDGKAIIDSILADETYGLADISTGQHFVLPAQEQVQPGAEVISDSISFPKPTTVLAMLGGEYETTTSVNGKPVVSSWK